MLEQDAAAATAAGLGGQRHFCCLVEDQGHVVPCLGTAFHVTVGPMLLRHAFPLPSPGQPMRLRAPPPKAIAGHPPEARTYLGF